MERKKRSCEEAGRSLFSGVVLWGRSWRAGGGVVVFVVLVSWVVRGDESRMLLGVLVGYVVGGVVTRVVSGEKRSGQREMRVFRAL